MDRKPQLTENEIMCRNLMERNGEIDGLRKWVADREAVCASLAEVRAQGVEMAMEHMQSSGSLTFGDCYISLNEFAAELRKGGNQ